MARLMTDEEIAAIRQAREAAQLGPYADVEAFIVGDGYSAINHLLGTGWRILSVEFVMDERGLRGTPDYRKQYIPYAAMGRAIAAGEMGDRVRDDAIQYSQAQQTDARLREEEMLVDVPPLVDEPDPDPIGLGQEPRRNLGQEASRTPVFDAPKAPRRKPQSIADTATASVRE